MTFDPPPQATMVMEVQKCKSVHSECLSTKEGADNNLVSSLRGVRGQGAGQ